MLIKKITENWILLQINRKTRENVKNILNEYGYNASKTTHLALKHKLEFPPLRLAASVVQQ